MRIAKVYLLKWRGEGQGPLWLALVPPATARRPEADKAQWQEQFDALREEVKTHVEQEEGDMFPEVDPMGGTTGSLFMIGRRVGSVSITPLAALVAAVVAVGMWATRERRPSAASCPRRCR